MSLTTIRGGRGLGDSIYLRPVVDYFMQQGCRMRVLTDYPEVFAGSGASTQAFLRVRTQVIAHYVSGKEKAGSTQWEDVCSSARIPTSTPLRMKWNVRNPALVDDIASQAGGRPIVLVHGGRMPMDRADGFGLELLPERETFDEILARLDDCFLVQIGKARSIYDLVSHLNLNDKTTVFDLLDLAATCDAVVAQCSFAVPLAEVFDKPLLAVWGSKALDSRSAFIRATTPEKVLSSPKDRFVLDRWSSQTIREETNAFRHFL